MSHPIEPIVADQPTSPESHTTLGIQGGAAASPAASPSAKWTAGKYDALDLDALDLDVFRHTVHTEDGELVAVTYGTHGEANAQRIALLPEVMALLRLARSYIPSLTSLALRIDDVLGKPDCRFCGSTLHWSGDCRAFVPTGKRP